MEYKYIIIDSDATSKLQLMHYLEEHGDFDFVGLSKNSGEGLDSILKYSPDVVFINLNEVASEYFQMVAELHQYISEIPVIIGISKTKDYAYQAIKSNFFDYWLMPYNEFDIRKSLLKLKKQTPKEPVPQKLCLQSYRDYHYVDTNDILYLQADNNATNFIMADGSVINAYKTLKTFEQQLPENFVRVHQSYILNTRYVARINYGKAVCSLKGQKLQLPFSKTYRENVDGLKKSLSKNSISALN
ncbi:response regulator transcription factor [Flavobacteriaceae bacterium TP-CH-4]|uniref:Response regulator transcription factor n=1 Tax=Pelagihabitans pacificus TaxID=2696054 RepID=A0A967AS44_9FLAO|nr:LytTR family DNA-binding domain-containing protein [Pelagihabitans pacificus]NHF59273.1 response regulator transcription factor [Pelagihabitans pacificus]